MSDNKKKNTGKGKKRAHEDSDHEDSERGSCGGPPRSRLFSGTPFYPESNSREPINFGPARGSIPSFEESRSVFSHIPSFGNPGSFSMSSSNVPRANVTETRRDNQNSNRNPPHTETSESTPGIGIRVFGSGDPSLFSSILGSLLSDVSKFVGIF
jgi:hypothetical protein